MNKTNQMNQIDPSRQSRSAILVEYYSVASPFAGGSLRILSSIDHNGQGSRCRDSAIGRIFPGDTSSDD